MIKIKNKYNIINNRHTKRESNSSTRFFFTSYQISSLLISVSCFSLSLSLPIVFFILSFSIFSYPSTINNRKKKTKQNEKKKIASNWNKNCFDEKRFSCSFFFFDRPWSIGEFSFSCRNTDDDTHPEKKTDNVRAANEWQSGAWGCECG